MLNRLRTSDSGRVQPGEELLLAGRPGGRGADRPPECDAGGLLEPVAAGLLRLRAGRAAGRGTVAGRGLPQPEPLLRGPARLPHLVVVVPQAGARAVLAGQHRDDVDVVGGVPDRDPADRVVVLAVRGEAGAVHDVAGELGPFVVGEHPVAGGGADRAVPDRFGEAAVAERFLGLLEQAGEVAEVAVAVVAERGFEFGGMAPAGDEVRVGVLLVAARAEEVVDQAGDAAAARADLADHWRIRFRTSSAAWSRSWARRMLSAA